MSGESTSFNEIKVLVIPNNLELSNLTFPSSMNRLLANDDENQTTDFNILQLSWIIRIIKQTPDQEPQINEQIYTPFKAIIDLLSNPNDNLNDSSEEHELSDFCEEKRSFDLEGTFKLEVSWEGKVKISNQNKEPISISIESLEQVNIDNVNAYMISISSPSVYIIGNVSIDKFYIDYDEIVSFKTPTLELNTESTLSIQESEINGLINNKGTIHLHDSGFLIVESFMNEGILDFPGKFYLETSKLFWNFGGIHAKNLKLKANVFYQLFVEGFSPIIDAEKLSIETFEEMKINTGEVSVNLMNITCLGTFENDIAIKGNDIKLTIQNPSINRGLFEFENIDFKSFSSFINQGIIHAEETMNITIEPDRCFYQENTLITPNLTINGKNISFQNTGNLFVNKLYVYGHLLFQNINILPSSSNDEDNKPSQENDENKRPNLLASFDEVIILHPTSEWINNGSMIVKNGEINKLSNFGYFESENLTVTDLIQKGIMNASQLHFKQNVINEGYCKIKSMNGKGDFANKGQFIISEEATVDFFNVEQHGIFYCEKMTGRINKWNEYAKSFIKQKDQLLMNETYINEKSCLELSGVIKGEKIDNDGLLCLNGCVLILLGYLKSSQKSTILLQSGPENFKINKESIISTAKGNAGFITSDFQFDGVFISNDGLLFDNVFVTKMQKLFINGDVIYRGLTAFDCFQNTDFTTSNINGAIAVLSQNDVFDITSPIIIDNALQLKAKTIIQESPINVKILDICAKETKFINEVVSEKSISIMTDVLEINSLVLSQKEGISIDAKKISNKGKIVTTKAPITIKSIELNNLDSILSEHSIVMRVGYLTTEMNSNISSPIIEAFVNELINKGVIQSEIFLQIESTRKISNIGEIKSNKLNLSTNILNNSKMIHGGNESKFRVKEDFIEDENSTIILSDCEIALPFNSLALQGQLILTNPTWRYYENGRLTPIISHSFDIFETAKLILINYNFEWNHFKNYGIFELHGGRAIGTNTYYASEDSITSFFGDYEFVAPKFDEFGITRSPNGICLTCGNGISYWGKYEVNGPIYFNIQNGISDLDASLNITKLANPTKKPVQQQVKNNNGDPAKKPIQQQQVATNQNQILFSKKSIDDFLYEGDERALFINGPFSNLTFTEKVEFDQNVEMIINSLTNRNTFSANDLNISTRMNIANNGLINSNGYLNIEANNIHNLLNGQIAAIYDVEISHVNNFDNCSKTSRILSQFGNISIFSSSCINNKTGSIQAGGLISLYANKNIDNTSGLILSFDSNKESTFCAPVIINSCGYKTENKNGRIIYTTTSHPGEIIINGNCQIIGKLVLEGGEILTGGTIFNDAHVPFSFEPKAIGEYKGCFAANAAQLVVTKLVSKGTQFVIGQGGLDIQSRGEVQFLQQDTTPKRWNTKDHSHIRFRSAKNNFLNNSFHGVFSSKSNSTQQTNQQTSSNSTDQTNVLDVVKIACRFPSLFNYNRDGVIRLRPPIQDDSQWDASEVVFKQNYARKVPFKFVISPQALQCMLNFLPAKVFGLNSVSSNDLLALIHNNSKKKAVNQVLSKEVALKDSFPSLIWEMRTLCYNTFAYPCIIIPEKIDPKIDIISKGPISITANSTIKLDRININSAGDVIIKSERDFIQNGGIIASAKKVGIKAKEIRHNAIKKSMYHSTYYGNYHHWTREELITDLPYIKAEALIESGNEIGEGVQIKVGTFDHGNGTLVFNPVVLNSSSYTWEKHGKKTQEMLVNQQTAVPVRIQARNANFHGDTRLIGTLASIDEIHMHSNLSLEAQVLTNKYSGKAVKRGFFRTSTMITDGTHQQAFQTQIRGNTFKDLSDNLSILKMRSSSLEFLKTEIKSDIKQEIMYLKNEDHSKIRTSGFSLPWFSDPRPALCKSLNSMLQANTNIDRVMSSIQTITNSIRLINDGANLVLHGASYMPNIVMGMANKMASFSIGTSTKVEVTKRSIPVPNTMKGEILNVKNKSTDLKGSVEYKEINIDTDSLNIEAPIEENYYKQEITETTFTFNPLSAIKSHNPGALLPSFSHYSSNQEITERRVAATHVIADKMRLNVNGDAHIKGVPVAARDFEGNITGNLKVESIQDEVTSTSEQESIGVQFGKIASIGNPTSALTSDSKFGKFVDKLEKSPITMVSYSSRSSKDVEKHVNTRAGIVGEDNFKLNVGGKLDKKSADVGKLEDGKVTNNGVNANEIVDKEIPDYSSHERSTFVCPIQEVVDLFGAVNEMMSIRRDAFESLKQSGMTEREAIEQLNDPQTTEMIKDAADTNEQIMDEASTAQENYETKMVELNQKFIALMATIKNNNEENATENKDNSLTNQPNKTTNNKDNSLANQLNITTNNNDNPIANQLNITTNNNDNSLTNQLNITTTTNNDNQVTNDKRSSTFIADQIMSLGSIMSDEHKCVLIENQLTHENQKLFRQIQKEYQSAENQRLNKFEKCEYKIFKKLSEYNKQLEECKKRNPKKVKVYRTCTDALSSGLSLIAYWKAGVKGAAVGSNIGGYIGGGIGFGIGCFTGPGVVPCTYIGTRVGKVVFGAVGFVGGVYHAYKAKGKIQELLFQEGGELYKEHICSLAKNAEERRSFIAVFDTASQISSDFKLYKGAYKQYVKPKIQPTIDQVQKIVALDYMMRADMNISNPPNKPEIARYSPKNKEYSSSGKFVIKYSDLENASLKADIKNNPINYEISKNNLDIKYDNSNKQKTPKITLLPETIINQKNDVQLPKPTGKPSPSATIFHSDVDTSNIQYNDVYKMKTIGDFKYNEPKEVLYSSQKGFTVKDNKNQNYVSKESIDTSDIYFYVPKMKINGGNLKYCKPKEVFRSQKSSIVQDYSTKVNNGIYFPQNSK